MAHANPNEDLAPEQFPDLNRSFYGSDPADYFRKRLDLLLLAAAKPRELDAMLADGFSYGDLTIKQQEGEPTDEGMTSLKAFISTEAEVLVHHASEALLRLYLAHAEGSPCPWLECAGLTSFKVFKKRVAQLRDEPIPAEDISRVFLGRISDGSDDEVQPHIRTMRRFLRLVAARLLSDSNLYNSAKHGLAVLSGPANLVVTDDQTGASFGGGGPSLSYLEIETKENKDRLWRRTTRWIDAEQTMIQTHAIITAMVSLWDVAKARYTGPEIEGVHVLTSEAVDQFAGLGGTNASPFTRSSFSLAYYQPLPVEGT
ncbi:hypothetical protein ABTY96_01615 [Streptomyces sp. NPDC096057]|uniref:hypothetical protein n=1 Tax=Streptomyces sp. NPDC096057 TaxID=3155543 RepID=UPI003321CE68